METSRPFVPLLTTTDWNEEWKELQNARRHADSAEHWDQRAATFHRKDAPNTYVTGFIDHLPLQPGDTIFDMGCGNGALALPLAAAGYHVIAADFSSKMLEILRSDAERKHLADRIETIHMSWSDNWENFGIGENCADIALASRSIATADLADSLFKLHKVARRMVAVTLTTSMSPRVDERILTDLGLQNQTGRDLIYAFNILAAHGVHPKIDYLGNDRHDRYETKEEAIESLARMRDDICSRFDENERAAIAERIDTWIENDLCQGSDEAGQFWHLSKPRRTEWAFLSWETDY